MRWHQTSPKMLISTGFAVEVTSMPQQNTHSMYGSGYSRNIFTEHHLLMFDVSLGMVSITMVSVGMASVGMVFVDMVKYSDLFQTVQAILQFVIWIKGEYYLLRKAD